jgi:pilus assembly protein CpaF
VIQVSRLQDGTRKIMNISEVVAAHDDHVELQDIFIFDRAGVDEQGRVQGTFRATGVQPRIMERFRVSGINLPGSIFSESLAVNL